MQSQPQTPIATLSVPIMLPQQISKERFEGKNNLDYFSSCEPYQFESSLILLKVHLLYLYHMTLLVSTGHSIIHIHHYNIVSALLTNISRTTRQLYTPPCPSPECAQLLMRDDISIHAMIWASRISMNVSDWQRALMSRRKCVQDARG